MCLEIKYVVFSSFFFFFFVFFCISHVCMPLRYADTRSVIRIKDVGYLSNMGNIFKQIVCDHF